MKPLDISVDRRSALSPAAFSSEYLVPERPVILLDEVERWPARRWTVDRLVRSHGDRPLRAYFHPDGLFTAWKRMRIDTTLGAILREHDPKKFVSAEVLSECPYLIPDFDIPSLIDRRLIREQAFVWLQPGGNRTGLHWDSHHSIIGVLAGRKRIQLFAPDQFTSLYPCPISGPENLTQGSWSSIDVFAPDLDRFPKARDARYIELTVDAGEMIFIPRHWWHAVENHGDPVMAISFFAGSLSKEEQGFYSDREVIAGLAIRAGLRESRA